jgi:hypothetical protein
VYLVHFVSFFSASPLSLFPFQLGLTRSFFLSFTPFLVGCWLSLVPSILGILRCWAPPLFLRLGPISLPPSHLLASVPFLGSPASAPFLGGAPIPWVLSIGSAPIPWWFLGLGGAPIPQHWRCHRVLALAVLPVGVRDQTQAWRL